MKNRKLPGRLIALMASLILLMLAVGVFADGFTAEELAEMAADADGVDGWVPATSLEPLGCSNGVPTNYYFSDFEANDGGWNVVSTFDDWEWGAVVPGVYEDCGGIRPEPAGAFSGNNVWANNLDGCYANSGEGTSLMQEFDLSTIDPPVRLTFWNWYHVFGPFDKISIWVNDTLLWSRETRDATIDWTQEYVDLYDYANNPSVRVRFRLYASTVVNRMGWYIDDAAIEYCAHPTAVTMDNFSADVAANTVTLNWTTSAEVNHAGYNMYRSSAAEWDASAALLTPALIASQGVGGAGAQYTFSDMPGSGVWYYFLQDVNADGITTLHGPVTAITQAPTSTALTGINGDSAIMQSTLVLLTVIALMVLAGAGIAYRKRA